MKGGPKNERTEQKAISLRDAHQTYRVIPRNWEKDKAARGHLGARQYAKWEKKQWRKLDRPRRRLPLVPALSRFLFLSTLPVGRGDSPTFIFQAGWSTHPLLPWHTPHRSTRLAGVGVTGGDRFLEEVYKAGQSIAGLSGSPCVTSRMEDLEQLCPSPWREKKKRGGESFTTPQKRHVTGRANRC